MALPQVINTILTQRTRSGYHIAQIGELQVLDLVGIGQGVYIETIHVPVAAQWWALIVYKIPLLGTMVPNSFTMVVRHSGRYIQNDTLITSSKLSDGIDCLAIVTQDNALAIRLTNNSTVLAPMIYQYGYSLQYLAVSSEDNLNKILEIWAEPRRDR